MTKKYTLDCFALLCFFQKERNWEKVKSILVDADKQQNPVYMCWVNFAEFYYTTLRRKGNDIANQCLLLTKEIPIQLIPADELLSLKAAEIKAQFPISLADSYCAATAITIQSTVVTGDKDFQLLSNIIDVEWL